ncbi:MAG: hypothetical protein H0W89_02865 [Candidatus Levybacteria bacterium]|nr:hypothetical protein [Candidatus Levybacteria bacterium]
MAPAVKIDGSGVVLKIGFPGDLVFLHEAKVLQMLDGRGMVRLLEVDWNNAAMLLERVEPGISLKADDDDDRVMSAVATVIQEIAWPIGDTAHFQTVAQLGEAFQRVREKHNGSSGPFAEGLLHRAESIFKEYTATTEQQYLLHGDLHNDNILSSQRGWLAIDPKGVIGPREYETAAFLRNPFYDLANETHRKERVTRRIDLLSEKLHFDKEKVLNWTFAQAMLSAVWTLEDHGEINTNYVQSAQLLSEII